MIRILHITPHLGGGVGKALSGLVGQEHRSGSEFEHVVLCLENPEKSQFVEKMRSGRCRLILYPSQEELVEAIRHADIVQIEFWNHPATVRALCTIPLPEMRLIIWCHVSGLHYPIIPPRLLSVAHKFLFTSACSLKADEVKRLATCSPSHLGVVSSGGGLSDLPSPQEKLCKSEMHAGYIGSLNFAKLHPDFVSFVAAVRDPGFHVRLIGDEINRVVMEQQCRYVGRPNLLEFRGYTTNVAAELAALDVLIYLLNPRHYGTAENTLLEAMAMGVVPVVLGNPAELCIVEDGHTGLVVRNPCELADALDWLAEHPKERLEMGRCAADSVRGRYTDEHMKSAFNTYYRELIHKPKVFIPFSSVFGVGPADWFRTFYRDASCFPDSGEINFPAGQPCHALLERTKGSVFHFLDYFPDDTRLQHWAAGLRRSLSQVTSEMDVGSTC